MITREFVVRQQRAILSSLAEDRCCFRETPRGRSSFFASSAGYLSPLLIDAAVVITVKKDEGKEEEKEEEEEKRSQQRGVSKTGRKYCEVIIPRGEAAFGLGNDIAMRQPCSRWC